MGESRGGHGDNDITSTIYLTQSHSEQREVTANTMPDMQDVALGNHPIQIPSGNQDTAATSLTLTRPPQSSPAS